ncbi:hypothetical protein [Lysobacter gummosus]|uniref:hypothetical protein n=1 Tax=Lysobacter gummosus TaxID=262324 RepID=UPI003643DB6C
MICAIPIRRHRHRPMRADVRRRSSPSMSWCAGMARHVVQLRMDATSTRSARRW